jgi:hypothetical protein
MSRQKRDNLQPIPPKDASPSVSNSQSCRKKPGNTD